MSIDHSRWRQIESVFQEAMDRTLEEREAFLSKACCGDELLRSEVEALLSNADSSKEFIEKPIWDDLPVTNAEKLFSGQSDLNIQKAGSDQFIGSTIGVYRIVQSIGRGGMGSVYLGERIDGEFRQKVALKLINRGMDSEFIIKRFRQERQILASLDHPNIARLLDGGRTPDGLPYFVLDYIEGDSLYDYCDRAKCDIFERLELFVQLCSAVLHAHEKKIIHRDLKPGNVQVTSEGIPKLLDFGIAKILDSDLIHESVQPTGSMVRLMTPDYASPEQVTGDEITISSDIYSLGILLYELLTGHKPYDLNNKSLREATRIICECVPIPPSAVANSFENLLPRFKGNPEAAAGARGTNLSNLMNDLRKPGIDRIVMRCLAKLPMDRYLTVRDLLNDLKVVLGEGKEFAGFSGETVSFDSDLGYRVTSGKSIAIMPFKTINLSTDGDSESQFLGLGLADALITRLSRIGNLVVRPTGSIAEFENTQFDSAAAGRKLNVDYLLEGFIKRTDERRRINVQLLDISTNATVWATSIDESIGDLLSLEDAVSDKIIEGLLPELTQKQLKEISKRGTENINAFEQFLRGRYHFNSSTEEGLAKAFVCFQAAITEDPEYAQAYAGLADYYNWVGIYGVLAPEECFRLAIDNARKAVELDSSLSEAHATLGFSLHAGEFDWAKGEYHLSHALYLKPNNANAMSGLSVVLYTTGRFDEGLRYARMAKQLDPLTPYNHHILAWGLYFARRFEEAEAEYRKVTANYPNYGLGYYGLSKVLRGLGRTAESLVEIENARHHFAESIFVTFAEAESYAAQGDTKRTAELIRELKSTSDRRFVSSYHLAVVYCLLGDGENALLEIEKAVETGEAWLNWIGVEPAFDLIRDQPGFQAALERTGYDAIFGNSALRRNATLADYGTDSIHNLTTIVQTATKSEEFRFRKQKRGHKRSKRKWLSGLAFAVTAILIVAAVFLPFGSGEKKRPGPTAFTGMKSIVVLPFETDSPADEILGVGIADALSGKLGYIKKLTVLSPNSARIVRQKKVTDIGDELKVDLVLSGLLVRNGEKLDLLAELRDSAEGEIVWKERFVSEAGDVFLLQTKVGEHILKSLKIDPLPTEREQFLRAYTADSSAYDLYLTGRFQLMNRSPESIRKAIKTFSMAIGKDSQFALAYAGLADSYSLLNLYEIPAPKDAYENARKNALKAISLDANLVEAHTSLAFIKFYSDRDLEGAELEYRRAIQLNPSHAQAHQWFGLLAIALDRPADAFTEIGHAEELDPSSPIIKTSRAMAYFYARRYDEAINEAKKVLEVQRDFVPAYRVLRWSYIMKNEYQPALRAYQSEMSFREGDPDSPGWYMITAQVESLSGNKVELIKNLDKKVSAPSVQNSPSAYSYEIAVAYNRLGATLKAFEWLERASSSGDNSFVFVNVDPRIENLRSHPRYRKLESHLK